ncbi:MAG TPA: RidA family protein [Candidatus Dormibacteraeota bacterium]|nr:RidA family protein [Candidatus Dormibacteraeota bacterium]
MTRRTISSGGHWEGPFGYSRAVILGDRCWVSGTTDAGADGRSRHPGDPAGQARDALGVIERALAEAGFARSDVVRTRMFITDASFGDAVGEVHGEFFADVRPASSMIVIPRLIEPSLLVEIEVEAERDPAE